jgi:DNA-binding GntR family transcriptional regulator
VASEATLVPLPLPTVADAATEAIRAAIVAHRYVPGAHLVEREVAAALGVSSIAVREAFGRLEREGLVERIPRRGTFVTSMSAAAVRDLARVRVSLEELVIELAIERWTAQAQAEVQAVVDEMVAAARSADPAALLLADNRFHQSFWEIAGSPILLELASNLRGRIAHFLSEATASLALDGQLEWSAGIHQAWLDAVGRGDVDAAKHEARRQILGAADRIEQWLASQAPAAGPDSVR